MRDGVLYIAFGAKYTEEALYSAETLKSVCSLPVTLFTDQPVESRFIDSVETFEPGHQRAKIDMFQKSPYARTLYLDSDTRVMRDLSELYPVLDRFELAAVHDHSRKSARWASQIPEYAGIPYGFPEFNSGVVLYRNDARLAAFFDLWRRYFYRYQAQTSGQDQATFRIALWESDLAIHSLPFEFNVRNQRIRNKMAKRGRTESDAGLLAPRILHWHGLDKVRNRLGLRAKHRPMRY